MEAAMPMQMVDIGGDILHGVINAQAGVNAAAGAIDIHLDIAMAVCAVQEQQLGGDDIGHFVVDRVSQEDDAVHHQPAVYVHDGDVHRALFNNVGGEIGDNVFVIVVQCITGNSMVFYSILLEFIYWIHSYFFQ